MSEQTKIADIGFERERIRPQPFHSHSASDLASKTVPELQWHIEQILVHGGVTLFSGPPGLGKSLLCLQLQVAAALGMPDWLGFKLSGQPTTSFGFYCEDDLDTIHRRLRHICNFFNVHYRDLNDRVLYVCRVGEERNALVTYKYDLATRTPLFYQLADAIREHDAKITVVDTVADAFLGNENARPQVRSFVTSMRHLAMINNGGLLLCAHPSRSGFADGSGQSGSTAWEGSVRARIYLSRAKSEKKDDNGDPVPNEERILKIMKSNYGPIGSRARLRFDKESAVMVQVSEQPPEPYWER
jgi:RecA-family ATPase